MPEIVDREREGLSQYRVGLCVICATSIKGSCMRWYVKRYKSYLFFVWLQRYKSYLFMNLPIMI